MKKRLLTLVSCLIVLAMCISIFAACVSFEDDTFQAALTDIEWNLMPTGSTPTSYTLPNKLETFDSKNKTANIYIKW